MLGGETGWSVSPPEGGRCRAEPPYAQTGTQQEACHTGVWVPITSSGLCDLQVGVLVDQAAESLAAPDDDVVGSDTDGRMRPLAAGRGRTRESPCRWTGQGL